MLHDFKPSDDGLNKAQRKAEIDRLREKLAAQQQSVMAAKLPLVVLVEGWDCAGKGHLINELISEMDPRFYRVAVYKRVPEVLRAAAGKRQVPFYGHRLDGGLRL